MLRALGSRSCRKYGTGNPKRFIPFAKCREIAVGGDFSRVKIHLHHGVVLKLQIDIQCFTD